MKVGDLVRVIHAGTRTLSEQRYEVTGIYARKHGCMIRQWPGPIGGGVYAEQFFPLDCVIVDNSGPELLAKRLLIQPKKES